MPVDPDNAVWSLTLEGAIEGDPLDIILARGAVRWTAAICAPGTYNNAVHDVNFNELKVDGKRISGILFVTLNPDNWTPKDRKSIQCRFEIEAITNDSLIKGSYIGKFGEAGVTGIVRGFIEQPVPVRKSSIIRLQLENAVDGWSINQARGLLDVECINGRSKNGWIRSARGSGCHGRVERLRIKLAGQSLRGKLKAVVGIRPGGTDLGGEKYEYGFQGTVVGNAVAGKFRVHPGDRKPFNSTFTGIIEDGTVSVPTGPIPGKNPDRKVTEINVMSASGPVVRPWKSFMPDTLYHGSWLVTGDLDNDGTAEIISGRNNYPYQDVTTVLASRLDGTLLWRWGEAGTGSQVLSYDVPLQIYDIDNDGRGEVLLSHSGSILVLDGRTGTEMKRFPLPEGLKTADCITFANLRGLDHPADILIKDRYQQIWAYTDEWKLLWHWAPEQPFRTCHHPTTLDINGDGRDEIITGFCMLNPDGTERWTVQSSSFNLSKGHLDACDILSKGKNPEDWQFIMTYCEALGTGAVDGNGKVLWEIEGSHFESTDVGKMYSDIPGDQILVDIDKLPSFKSRLWLLDSKGTLLAELICRNGRFHRLIDWDGDGLKDILIASDAKLFSSSGKCLAQLSQAEPDTEILSHENDESPFLAVTADLDGDNCPEIILHSRRNVLIYKSGQTPAVEGIPAGTPNYTLY